MHVKNLAGDEAVAFVFFVPLEVAREYHVQEREGDQQDPDDFKMRFHVCEG